MKVGLVRHFAVKKGYPEKRFVAQSEVMQWFEEYDAAEIEAGAVDLGGVEWKRCYSSDLYRAVKTAELIYPGTITPLKELREIPIDPVFQQDIKLPFLWWAVLVRAAWLLNHKSQRERKTDVRKRIEGVLDQILSQGEEDVLIVCHAALMIFMRKELLKRGFTGPAFRTPENGKLYLFER
jgi:broad specificity phosphatase PhoE